jgi:spore germination protein GerM
MKSKPKRRSSQKAKGRKVFLLLLLTGIGLIAFFHQQIYDSIKPFFSRRGILVQRKEVLLYFSDGEGEYLRGERRKILRKDTLREEAKEVVIELIKGPEGRLLRTLPSRTKLLNLQINGEGLAKVNFNQALSKDHPGGSSAEMMTVYSIVNSLSVNFPQIKRVQILIDGKPIETISGHLSLNLPLSPKPDLIRGRTKSSN